MKTFEDKCNIVFGLFIGALVMFAVLFVGGLFLFPETHANECHCSHHRPDWCYNLGPHNPYNCEYGKWVVVDGEVIIEEREEE